MSLAGKKVVVVGGSSGIGLEIARQAIAQGASAVVASRSARRLSAAVADLGERAQAAQVDLSDEASVRTLFQGIGAFDHLVLTAADLAYGPLLQLDLAAARRTIDTKVWGYLCAARHGAPHLRRDGSITLFSGLAAHKPTVGAAMVATVNGAVEALGRALAVELAPLRVNVVCPGVVETPAWSGMPEEQRKRFFSATAQSLPARCIGAPTDLAEAALFVMQNRFTTGSLVHVDGGARLG
ncbi:SDR family oxidoreductase [Vulgatibacter incomptus]|uniref:Short chain dehydrogenase n=1 Tax=Vulgatibacter incomptus TaxID=1391653 RepID=A0A0K1PC56_9BACT|nr:SDR family oxidoreductase [Vulgatibacter incomptus]AKU91100.1 Short chain dehydrogenase [Vulgatibacter incomptus]